MAGMRHIILRKNDPKLQKLFEGLKHRSMEALKVQCEVLCVLQNKIQRDFIVDSWPDFKVVIGKPHPDEPIQFLNNIYSVYAESMDAFSRLISEDGIIDWTKRTIFSAISDPFIVILEKEIERRGGEVELSTPCHTLFIDKASYKDWPVPASLSVTALEPSEAEMLNSEWKYSGVGQQSLQYHSWTIQNFHSVCVRDSAGKALGYATQQWFGSMGAVYVKPEHRGKGLGKGLFPWLAGKLLKDGLPVYTHTEVDNQVSLGAQKAVGAKIADVPLVTWVFYTPSTHS